MTGHVEDGALVRHLDGEGAAEERATVTAHLGACTRCAARLADLRRTADALTVALGAADEAASRARPRPRWGVGVAAALVVLAGIGGMVRPVRAWIGDRILNAWELVTGRADGGPVPLTPSRSASVAFVPVGDELTLEVTVRQMEGVLQIETGPGDTAVAVVRNGTGTEDLVVLPNALRIVNTRASTASYVLRVPARLSRVRVRVGDAAEWHYRPGGAPREIELGNR